MPVILPIATHRRGACPTLDAPMQTGDGLLARLRIKDRRLTPQQLGALADLAGEHGNGLVEISARGNLQVRGLTPGSAAPFARGVEAVTTIERGLVVETPPLAGDDPSEIDDPRPLAGSIRAASMLLATRLGPKVTVIVDGNGRLNLSQLKADIRLTAIGSGQWACSVGGRSEIILRNDALMVTLRSLRQIADLGLDARGTDLAGEAGMPRTTATISSIGSFALRQGTATGIVLPFGSIDHLALKALAVAAAGHGITQIRLAPQHGLLLVNATAALLSDAEALGFIVNADDPRLRISACIGSDGCSSGHIPARQVATRLAPTLPDAGHLHVAGCEKGCAHPRRAALTLVGREDGYGLVIEGTAGDTPAMILRDDQIESTIARSGKPG